MVNALIRSEDISEAEHIYRDINFLLSIRRGTLPLNRDFGISWDSLSEPLEEVEEDITLEIMAQVDRYIPGALVREVSFDVDEKSGKLIPTIYIERRRERG